MEPHPQPAQPILNIVGDLIALGPLDRSLIPLLQRWYNDWSTLRMFSNVPRGYTLEQVTADYEQAAQDDRSATFTIHERATGRAIGTAALHTIDYRHGTAEFVILIGEPDARGKGYGTEVARLMLDYAFTALGLHNVFLTVYAFNEAGLNAYRKAGFREFGRRREAKRIGGRRWDVIYMDCLARDFTSPVLGRVFVPDVPRETTTRQPGDA